MAALSVLLGGCTSTPNGSITSSFDEVTSGQRHTGGTFPQIYAASVNGLLPFAEPGELYFYPNNRGILGAIGISSYTNDTSAGTVTYKLVREYPSTATLDDLAAVRANIATASAALVKAIRLQRAAAMFSGATNQNVLTNALLWQQQGLEASEEAQLSLGAVRDAITRSNIVLFQWTASEDGSLALKVGSLFGGSARSHKSLQGYALVAGFRTSTLFVGEDLIQEIASNMENWSKRVNRGLGVPTFTIEGARILYFSQSELLKEIQAALKASPSQFKNAANLVASIDQVEIKFLAQQLENLSNTGLVAGPVPAQRVLVPMTQAWGPDEAARDAASEGWSPFYSVITRTRDVYEALKRKN